MGLAMSQIDSNVDTGTPSGEALLAEFRKMSHLVLPDGKRIGFFGQRVWHTGSFGRPGRAELYQGPVGFLLYFVEREREHWAAGGATVAEALAAVAQRDRAVHDAIRPKLERAGLLHH